MQSITNALAQTPQTTPGLKRLVEAIVGTAADFTIAGDAKALLEAETPFDYLMASIGVVPGAGEALLGIKMAKDLFKEGKVAESAKILEDLSGGAKETVTVASEATSLNAQAALRAKLSGLQKAQQTAAVTKTLPDGRVRYYTQEVPARTEGATRGASFVTEHNPQTGQTRQWMESYDQSGNVIRVHPKSINGQPVSAQHYPPTGAELESWK